MTPPRRKKWTEVEERTLIEKYGEMERDRTLAKMKTREKKYKPIALYVNSVHHFVDPITYPWQWTWKDVSTKVQNMRHQYALVKQKIKKHSLVVSDSGLEEFDWVEGLTHWSNFSRYKEVFGDVTVNLNGNDLMVDIVAADPNIENGDGFDNNGMEIIQFGHLGHHHHHAGEGDFAEGFDGGENGVLSLDFDYEGGGDELGEENHNCGNNHHPKEDVDDGYVYEDHDHDHEHSNNAFDEAKKKRKVMKGLEKKAWGFLSKQTSQLKELETRLEQREVERDRERQKREQLMAERREAYERDREERDRKREERERRREELRMERNLELEAMEREMEEREKRRREEELIYERKREERMNGRREEWKKSIEEMVNQYRVGMGEIQSRIVHEQQNLTGQLLGLISQWTGQGSVISDHHNNGGASNHYLSQMMVNDMVVVHEEEEEDPRVVEGGNHLHHQDDDQFIVDG
ncbi:matrix metalloproteinase-2-like [Impatiens glandulifera]|uniref:matrix metalloproteinase-2-like n=1 Tax=Impatiens glandulifera TaxID=253017 RepID=UPI001FB135AE|nr:matrix metalloproteinase-2-like [Impatiens glandulifera]XP_047313291.1 matrix metalloproteinase-2-like [Impatiens glandulifera]